MSRRAQILKYIGLLSFLSATGFLLHLPSELAVSLAIPPDSTEYAMGLANLFGHGVFGFTLNGEWYPSRYAPWFSLFRRRIFSQVVQYCLSIGLFSFLPLLFLCFRTRWQKSQELGAGLLCVRSFRSSCQTLFFIAGW